MWLQMKICTLASSSSGNCTLVSQGGTHILIDAGISLRRITASLKNFGISPDELQGVLITHEHSDHINGIKMLAKYHKLPIFAPLGVAESLCGIVPEARESITWFHAGTEFVLGEIAVKSFLTPHDTPESVGYRFEAEQSSLVFVTDIGCVTQTVLDAVLGADMAVIEANHDIRMLKYGSYPAYLKRRILSERGHLSNDDSGRLATRMAASGTRRIVLAHLSRENNTPRLAYDTVGSALVGQGAVVGGDIELDTAPADEMGKLYII
jgi:phosphoribosyl 1,2-cyclic phosphodiesterase